MRKQQFSFAAALIAILLLIAALPAAAQSTTFGLSDDDFALWSGANAASSAQSQFAYAFTLTLDAPNAEGAVSGNLTGTGAVDSDAQAFSLAVSGTLTTDGTELPVSAELRLVDGNFYFNATDPTTGEATGWMGDSIDSLTDAATGMSAFGLPVDPSQLTDPQSTAALGDLTTALATFDPSSFISIARAADDKIGDTDVAHFVLDLSLTDLLQNESLSQMIQAAAAADTTGSTASTAAMLPMMATAFENSTVTLEQYVALDTSLIKRTVLTLSFDINPAMLGETGDPVSLDLVFDISLSAYGETPTIEAPADAQMGVISGMMGGMELPVSPDTAALQPMTPTFTPESSGLGDDGASSSGTLTADTPIEVQFNGGDVTLTYESTGDQTVNIIARSVDGSLDTTLTLQDAQGVQLAYNDDHNSDRDLNQYDSLIADQNLEAGTYNIVVSTFSGSGSGAIEVTVETGTQAPPLNNQPDSSTATGDAIVLEGDIGNNETYETTFAGTQGQTVTITARATDSSLDTVVELIGPDGDSVAENDDHGTSDRELGQYDSRIESIRLPSDGEYTVTVRGFAGASGTFELTIAFDSEGGSSSSSSNGAAIDRVSETLRPGDTFTYTLNASAGDVYTITAYGADDEMDTVLAMYDAEDTLLANNDDHGSSDSSLGFYDARIERFIFQDDGEYIIEVSGYNDAAGEFELVVERLATDAPTGDGDEDVFTGEIRPNGSFDQEFEAEAGDYVTVTVRALSDEFDASVSLISPDGVVLQSNDDHGGSDPNLSFFDARITHFIITESGTYTVEVTGYRDSAGSFALVINTK